MKIAVFGMGYVGCITVACLADLGHEVWGVDVNAEKVGMIAAGRSPVTEPQVEDLLDGARHRDLLVATMDAAEAIEATDLSIICVGTPSNGGGNVDLSAVTAVSRQIGAALRDKRDHHCVVFRSTVLPGTVRQALIPTLEAASGKRAHHDFSVCNHPEFLREGSAVNDFFHPPLVVIGQETREEGDILAKLYEGFTAPLERTTYEVAELLKYASNAFHALKVTFGNEIGSLCKSLGIDSHQVIRLFALDTKLNISAAYLKPGFAFGGSCLPKDLRALLYRTRHIDLHLPMLASVLESNRLHLERVIERVLATREKRIGILGLSFKAGTDDLRESPSVTLIETLIGKGCQVKIYDPDVVVARIFGANKRFIEREVPHISCLMSSNLREVIDQSEVIVVSKPAPEFRTALESAERSKLVFDLVRLAKDDVPPTHHYDGICW